MLGFFLKQGSGPGRGRSLVALVVGVDVVFVVVVDRLFFILSFSPQTSSSHHVSVLFIRKFPSA